MGFAKTPDKILHVRDLSLLLVITGLLQCETFSFGFLEAGVVTGKKFNRLMV